MIFSPAGVLRNSKVFLLATLAVCGEASAAAWVEALGPSASVRATYWTRSKDYAEDRAYAESSLWLTLRPEELAGFKFYADGFVSLDDIGHDEEGASSLRELFVERSIGAFDFKLGRMITVWGRADKVNPTDHLSVRDFRRAAINDEDQLEGVGSAQVVYNWDELRLIALWTPEWRSPRFPLPTPSGIRLGSDEPSRPEDQWAFKIDRSGGAIDWSFSYFKGYSKTPDIALREVGPSGATLALTFGEIQSWGADFASTWGEWGLRGELAYTTSEDSSGRKLEVMNPETFLVLGVERSPWEDFNVNLQALYKHVEKFQDPASYSLPFENTLATFNQVTSNQLAADQYGYSLRPSLKFWSQTLETEVAYVEWQPVYSSLLRPKLTYAVNDHLKASVGGEVYRGRQSSFFGRLRSLSSGFAEVRFSF